RWRSWSSPRSRPSRTAAPRRPGSCRYGAGPALAGGRAAKKFSWPSPFLLDNMSICSYYRIRADAHNIVPAGQSLAKSAWQNRRMTLVALKMLTGDRSKSLGLIFGISFATLLMAQQLSVFLGIMRRTASQIIDVRDADIWVMDNKVRYVDEV